MSEYLVQFLKSSTVIYNPTSSVLSAPYLDYMLPEDKPDLYFSEFPIASSTEVYT